MDTCKKGKASKTSVCPDYNQPRSFNQLEYTITFFQEYRFLTFVNKFCLCQVKCSVDTPAGYTLDFSPLIKKTGKYNVIPSRAGGHQPSGLIYINLCRPLNPIFGTLCPAGSGACLVKDDKAVVRVGLFFL